MSEPVHSGIHPDADSLSAFAEGALPEHERQQCLAHLGECAVCREIVFLAHEPVEAAVAPARAERPWWQGRLVRVPALVAFAGLVIVGSVAIFRVTRPALPVTSVADSVKPAPSFPVVTPQQPASKAEPQVRAMKAAPSGQPEKKRAEASRDSAREAPVAPAASPPAPPPAASPALAVQAPLLSTPSAAVGNFVAPETTPLRAAAPTAPSSITGTVTDPAGARIPAAAVDLRRLDSGDTRSARTDSAGQFSIAGIAPGRYEVQVNAPGFVRSSRQVEISPQEIAKADSVLKVGSSTDSVTVTAETSLLRSEPASLGVLQAGKAQAPEVSSYALPSKLHVAASAARDKIFVAADSAGALFRSTNGGKSWKAVKGPWQGKVVRLRAPLIAPEPNTAGFELTTDSGRIWLSRDGSRWNPAAGQQ